MNKMPEEYVQRVYAGLLGKIIGVRHGSNDEGWDYDRIKAVYGVIDGYLFDFKNFAADDDINGPLFFIRALGDYTCGPALTPEEIGLTWLNYTPYEHGFYWWGGYGKSTEHTAYLNLRSGIKAPRSGSAKQNGIAVAEQIGGQIFIDSWGLAVPEDFRLAAEYARKAASVSHDGNGVYGGMFIAACISAAFAEKDMEKIIEDGLSVIPDGCEYTRMCRDVVAFHNEHPVNFRKCFQFVREHYGYDRYPGSCHIIPNSAVIVLSLLYGDGDFSKSINIANMCGWDTDCNVGNVGTILGVKCGLGGIDKKWREPINDFVACSSVIGSLNINDIASCAYYIAKLGYRLAGTEPEQPWKDIFAGKAARYNFELPGSTHSFMARVQPDSGGKAAVCQTAEASHTGRGSLKVTLDASSGVQKLWVYKKTYYRPSDFSDSRYDPAFSPILYPGQTVSASVMLSAENGGKACLYVKDGNSGKVLSSEEKAVAAGSWTDLVFKIPRLQGACIEEVGVMLTAGFETGKMPAVYLDDVDFSGFADYSLDFAKERMEVWSSMHTEVSQFTYLQGIWTLEDAELSGSCSDYGEAYTGDYDWKDYTVEATVIPKIGECHNINFRVQGAIRSYAAGLSPDNTITLYKNENGYRILEKVDFRWEMEKSYRLKITVRGNKIEVRADDTTLIRYEDKERPYLTGQIGMSVLNGSHCHYRDLSVQCG